MTTTPLAARRAQPLPGRLVRSLVAVLAIVAAAVFAGGNLAANAVPVTGSISGFALQDGVPTAGLVVEANPQWAGPPAPLPVSVSTVTAADGSYSFPGLEFGTYFVSLRWDSAYQNSHIPPVTISELAPDAIAPDLSRLTLLTGTAVISGTVTDAATLAPLAGAFISFDYTGPDPISSAYTSTGADGSYTVTGLAAATYMVHVSQPGYISAMSTITVADGQSAAFNLALVPANSGVAGHVQDQNGNPVVGLGVNATPVGGGLGGGGGYVQTDAGGNYAILGLGAGDYTVSVGGSGTPWELLETTVSAPASASAALDLVVTARTTAAIGGWISATDSYNVDGIRATIIDATTGATVAVSDPTSPDGTYFVTGLAPGTYTVLFEDVDPTRSPRYATTYLGGSSSLATATIVTVTAGEDSYGNDIQLVRSGSISGHLTVATEHHRTGELPSGRAIDVTVFQLVNGVWQPVSGGTAVASATSLGDYTVSGLAPGTYRVGFADRRTGHHAYAPVYWQNAASLADAQDVIVTEGATTADISATLRTAPHAEEDGDDDDNDDESDDNSDDDDHGHHGHGKH